MRNQTYCAVAATAVFITAGIASADITIDYMLDAGGNNGNPLNGLSAHGTFATSGNTLTITLVNTSSGVPAGAEAADSLLVSLALNLGDGVEIVSGDSAVIGAGSNGLGQWSGLGQGDSVADQWLWTNDGGGDLLAAYTQVISTSTGQGGGSTTGFDGTADPSVGGPFGGIAADPVLVNIPNSQRAVSDSIEFVLTLNSALSDDDLAAIAGSGIVEFGSDFQYLAAPAPSALAMLGLAGLGRRRRRA